MSVEAFRAEIFNATGYAPEVIDVGVMQRFSTNGKRGDTSGWCKLFDDRRGVYGDFRAGISAVWSAREKLAAVERVAFRRQIAAARLEREAKQKAAFRRNDDRIRSLWRQTREVANGDAVDQYLRRRLVVDQLEIPKCIRIHPAMPYVHDGEPVGKWPAMVAPLVGHDGKVLALHRTYLTLEGQKASVPGPVKKLTPAAGVVAGASIPLTEATDGLLGVAEGIETALAASLASGGPVVAAYSATGLKTFLWPKTIQRLVIFGDHDAAGIAAAEALHTRALRAGLASCISTPATESADWCDVWASRVAA